MVFNPANGGVSFLNPDAVTTPAPGTFGNCPVGAFNGPGYKSADLSLAKEFSITEWQSLEFRMDMSNFTNTPIFNFGQEFSGHTPQERPTIGRSSPLKERGTYSSR